MAGDADSRILGVATAEQVLKRWYSFLRESRDELRTQAATWEDRHCLKAEGPPTVERASTVVSDKWEDDVEAMGLHSSPIGYAIEALATSMAESRACVTAARQLYRPLALFGEAQEGHDLEGESVRTGLLVEFADLLPVMGQTKQLLERVSQLATHLVQQLAGLRTVVSGGSALPLRPALDALSELLTVPVMVDGLCLENEHLRDAFASYSWVVGKHSSDQEGRTAPAEISAEAATMLGGSLREVQHLVVGDAFKLCIDSVAADLGSLFADGSTGDALRDSFASYFRSRLEESEAVGTAAVAQLELPAESLVPWVCTFVLFASVWKPGRSEVKLTTDVLKMHRLSPVVVLHGRIAWCIGDFLKHYLPAGIFDTAAQKDLADMKTLRQRQAVRLDEGHFVQEMQRSATHVQVWLAGLGATSRALGSGNVSQALKEAHAVLLRGLALALRIRASLEEYLVLHIRSQVPVPKSCLQYISLGFQLLKGLEAAPSAPRWAELSMLLQRHMALRLHTELEDAQKVGFPAASAAAAATAVKVALGSTYRIVGGAPADRLDWYFDVGAMALCCAGQAHLASSGKKAIWRELRIMSRWWEQLARLCDTSWSYWVREFLPELLKNLSGDPRGAPGLPRLVAAFATPLQTLVPMDTKLGRRYIHELRSSIRTHVVNPLTQKIEQDLRLHTHSVMQSSPQIMPKAPGSEVMRLLELRPLSLTLHAVIDIKDQVEQKLGKMFYDLTALAPHDAEAYSRMRSLARDRYGLSVLDGHLPSGSLDHGLDVIDIMRSIHLFAAQYSYSLHQQVFAQAANQGDAKIRLISVEHLATSIRTHGMGIINTTVNYTYGFMKRKLEKIVEFMSDETVKSRMLADARWMEQQRSNRCGYTWTRALETRAFIRRLGSINSETSFLDGVRQFVTQIGNSLGYVRMVRSAGMRCVARSLPYVELAVLRGDEAQNATVKGEDVEDATGDGDESGTAAAGRGSSFLAAAKAAECPSLVTEAAQVADEAVQSVRQTFEASTDYLNLLAQVFSKALGGKQPGSPMSLFHLLVPALTLSFIDSMLVGREALAKRAIASASTLRSNALCFDDGFAVGVACILSIFGHEHDFQALHWLDAEVLDVEATNSGPTPASAPTPADAGGPANSQSATAKRREMLQQELKRVAATMEAASSLFDSV